MRAKIMHKAEYRSFIVNSPEELFPMFLGVYGQSFIFRGMRDAKWPLQSKLERHRTMQRPHDEEKRMLREFQRCAHNYSHELGANLPLSLDEPIEWLALMRHYGGITRLVDFTKSVFVAAYFAVLHEDPEDEEYAAIWAIN